MKNPYSLIFLLLLSVTNVNAQNILAIPDTLSGTTFNLNILDTSTTFYSGYSTNTFGVNAAYLGPTLFLNKGDSVFMHVNNQLMDTTTIHWHGLHVSAMNDGGPHITIAPGNTWSPSFVVRDNAAMYWYHPHLHMMTNLHASLGAAGLIIVRDTIEAALALPRTYGIDDFPLVIQSKCFDATKQILINNPYDSVIMVNGTINPYLPTPAQVVRLRLLNASSERAYNIGLQGNLTFYQIGTDGGLLNAPVALTRLRISPGERADIVVNFTGMSGQTINLMSFASELPNGIYGATQPGMMGGQTIPGYTSNILNGSNFNIISFNIIAPTINPITTIPTALITNTPWPILSANATKTLTFSPVNMGPTAIQGPFLINNTSFNMNVVNYSIPLNNIEIWTLTNQSPIAHPFHIHDVQFYITEINGALPPANMMGRKDVILVLPQQSVKFIAKFEDFCDSMSTYMYHCHMLPHEDDGMMGQFNVICPTVGVNEISLNAKITIYPNPASTKIKVTVDTRETIKEINIIDINGKTLLSKRVTSVTECEVDISAFGNGIYFLQIETSKNNIYKKFSVIN